MKNGPIDKILRIQLGLYIRKPGKKSLTQKKLILIRGIAFEKNGPCSLEIFFTPLTDKIRKVVFEVFPYV